jgi:Wzt C-terminal domain/Sulfotransferase family
MRVCFIHVPKTAGTSVLSVMSAHFGAGNVFHVEESRFWTVPIAYLLRRHPIIAGHFSVRYLSNEVLESVFVFTFLRDPLERLLSQYGYFRGLSHESNDPEIACARTQDLAEILRFRINSGRFTPWTNWQTKIFSGCDAHQPATSETLSRAKHNLEQLAFVGIQDELREGVATLLRIWGGTDLLELPNLNRTVERLPNHVLDTETRCLIEESNWLDRELYLHARQLWRSRHLPKGKPDLKTDLLGKAEHGSKEIVIMSLMIEGDVEAGCRVYPHKPWTLSLILDSSVVEANLTIGIKISDAVGVVVYGTNSFLQGRSFAVGPGEFIVRIDFPEVTLAPGRYFITAALHTGFASKEKCYHWMENALEFQVIPEDAANYIGAFDLAARFRDPEPSEHR